MLTRGERQGSQRQAQPQGLGPSAWSRSAGSALTWAYRLVPLGIGLPVLAGVVITLIHLLSTRFPDLGWSTIIASDAKAVALGHFLYHDPARSYTGLVYGPLFPVLLAPLYRVFWWDGWPLAVTIASALGLATMAGSLAAGPRPQSLGNRIGRLAIGVGIGGLGLWIASSALVLYDGRMDELAWLLALAGLCCSARVVAQRQFRAWPAIVLLSAAFWTKQTTVGAAIAVVLTFTWFAARRVLPWHAWRRFVAALVVTNMVIFIVLWLVTDGWVWFFLFDIARKQASDAALAPYVRNLRNLVLVPVVLVCIAAGASILSRRMGRVGVQDPVAGPEPRSEKSLASNSDAGAPVGGGLSFVRILILLLCVFLVCATPVALRANMAQGAAINQYVGIMWALTLLFALGYRAAAHTRAGAIVVVGLMCVVSTVPYIGSLTHAAAQHGIALPTTVPIADFRQVPLIYAPVDRPDPRPLIRNYAAGHRVYVPLDGGWNAESFGEVWPSADNINDLLAAGKKPGYLMNALLSRHFDAVAPFDFRFDAPGSLSGRTEDHFLWKLNQVIAAGYRPVPGSLSGLWERIPGPNAAVELRTCFDPFDLAGARWVIRTGGGLWCQAPNTAVVQLKQTPVVEAVVQVKKTPVILLKPIPVSELRSRGPVRARGSLRLRVNPTDPATVASSTSYAKQWREANTLHVELRIDTAQGSISVLIGASAKPGVLAVTVKLPSGVVHRGQVLATPAANGSVSMDLVFGSNLLSASRVGVPISRSASGVVRIFATSKGKPAFDFSRLRLSSD